MSEVTTTKERVIKASETCPDAKGVLKELFPEVFKIEDRHDEWKNITEEIRYELTNRNMYERYILHIQYCGTSIGYICPNKGIDLYTNSRYRLDFNSDAFRILKRC